jgi:hypothetical protein
MEIDRGASPAPRGSRSVQVRVVLSPLAMEDSMISRFVMLALAIPAALAVSGCSAPALSPQGANVAVSRNAPPPSCASVGYIVGEGGGTFGGKWIANDELIDYAMNDLRNKAASLGAGYVQSDPPQLGNGHGTTTTVIITGTAYRCNG